MAIKLKELKYKLGLGALLVTLAAGTLAYPMGPSGETQWFSTEYYGPMCIRTCFDPGDGSQVIVSYQEVTCEADWFGTCTTLPCGLSCRDLLRMGFY